jgi:hypothetical protein
MFIWFTDICFNKETTRSTNYGYNSSSIYNASWYKYTPAAHILNSLIVYHTAVIKLEIGLHSCI